MLVPCMQPRNLPTEVAVDEEDDEDELSDGIAELLLEEAALLDSAVEQAL